MINAELPPGNTDPCFEETEELTEYPDCAGGDPTDCCPQVQRSHFSCVKESYAKKSNRENEVEDEEEDDCSDESLIVVGLRCRTSENSH